MTSQVSSATNTQYFIEAADVDETRSWCYHLKHNIAVLVSSRYAFLHRLPLVKQ